MRVPQGDFPRDEMRSISHGATLPRVPCAWVLCISRSHSARSSSATSAAWFCLGALVVIKARIKLKRHLCIHLFIYLAVERSLRQGVRAPNYSAHSQFSRSSLAAHSPGLPKSLSLIPFLLFISCEMMSSLFFSQKPALGVFF